MRPLSSAVCLPAVACLLLTACPSQESSNTATSTNLPVSASAPAVAIAPLPPSAERQRPSHLEPAKPAASAPCKALPEGSGATHELARVIRELTCTPELFYKAPAEVEAALKLPEGVEFHFSGPRSAALKLKTAPSAKELAKAMGIESPVITTASSGAWATHNWYLGSNKSSGKMDLWGPANAAIGVGHRGKLDDTIGTVKELKDEALTGYITIAMPESVIAVRDDDVALKMLIHAVTKIAASPSLLKQEPEEIAKRLGLDDGRFRVTRVAIGTGPSAIKGVDLWIARSQVAAAPIIETFGLKGKIEHERAHDSDSIVLHVEGTPPGTSGDDHLWKGITLKPTFEPRSGVTLGSRANPKDYTLDGVQVMPGNSKTAP